MTKEQATEIYEGLMVLLREYGLSWVVDEVQSAVTEGKNRGEGSPIPAGRTASTGPPTAKSPRRPRSAGVDG